MDDPSPPTRLPAVGLGGRPDEAEGHWLLPLAVGSEAGQGGLQGSRAPTSLGSGHGSKARGTCHAQSSEERRVFGRGSHTCPLGPSLWGPDPHCPWRTSLPGAARDPTHMSSWRPRCVCCPSRGGRLLPPWLSSLPPSPRPAPRAACRCSFGSTADRP